MQANRKVTQLNSTGNWFRQKSLLGAPIEVVIKFEGEQLPVDTRGLPLQYYFPTASVVSIEVSVINNIFHELQSTQDNQRSATSPRCFVFVNLYTFKHE